MLISTLRRRPLRTHLLVALVALAGFAAGASRHGRLHAQSDPNVLVDPKLYADLQWRSVGSHRGGRSTAITGVRTEPCTFYMGATGGGVWKTTNCGALWTPATDGQIATGSIGSIDVSDRTPATVYVGTGSAAIRSNVIIGRGVYRSADAGRTWQFAGLRDAGQIGSIRVHPTNPDIVWAAAMGTPYGPSADRGIFKTTDGGKTWKKTLFVDNETGGRVVAYDPSNPDIVYAGMYRAFRKGWDIVSGGPADKGGIYKSTDGGNTWKHITAGLPADLIGKIDLDVARSNPKVLYAMVEAVGDKGGLYKSEDAGESWKLVNNSARLRARPFYFHYVDINPKNDNEVWVNELAVHKSVDGGRTWTDPEPPHGDNHGVWFNPDNPDYMIQSNDGGATVSIDGGKTWSTELNQPTAEFYMVAVDNKYPYNLYAPQQDNSTVVVPSVPPVSWPLDHPTQAWFQASGCETGQISPRPDGSVIWGACKGEVGRYNVNTGQEQHYWIYPQNRYSTHPDDIRERYPRQTIVYVSPHDPKTVYQASHRVWKTMDEGATWTRISDDLTAHEKEYQVLPGSPITRDVTGEEVYSSLYAFTESRLERGVLWAGANDGPVHVSRDGGKTWKNVTPKDLVGARIQNIEDSPHRRGSAYIAAYRTPREHDLRPYIYVTNDYGATWTKLTDGTNGIPYDSPTRLVREDPDKEGLLYVGTEFGAFVSFDNGRHFQTLQQNLPATPVTDIRVHRKDLAISTMGRSFWIMDNITPLQQLAAMITGQPLSTRLGPGGVAPAAATRSVGASAPAKGAPAPAGLPSAPTLFTPRDAVRLRTSSMGTSPDVPHYPAVATAIDYWLPGGFTGDVTIDITDAAGKVVRSYSSAQAQAGGGRGFRRGAAVAGTPTKKAGLNRFFWDYRWSGNGPMVAPGRFTVKFTAGGPPQSKSFGVAVDPRVLADNITVADLKAQEEFLLKVRDVTADAQKLADAIKAAIEKQNLKMPRTPMAGETVPRMAYDHPLQKLYALLVTATGAPYEQGMLIDQLGNVTRMLSQADQKVGNQAPERFADLQKQLAEIKAEAAKNGVTGTP